MAETSEKGRRALLDRLVPVTGLNRSYLATVLSSYSGKADEKKSLAKAAYIKTPEISPLEKFPVVE